MSVAIDGVKHQLGKTYPLIIGKEKITNDDLLVSTNPSRPEEIIGKFSKANTELAERAVNEANKAFPSWSKLPGQERARFIYKAAAIIRRRKHEIAAWMVWEIGKSWVEADADVAEAIDFCEFYAREMVRLSQPQPLTPYSGEENELYYIPLGVGLVVPPWNFPFAILVGMCTAAIVAGNCVILKPSSETPAISYQFVSIMEEAGLPAGVLNFLPGPGASVGDFLVDHPQTRFIAFTGSKEVGLRINERAAKPQKGQLWIKRVIAEMGGKDSIIVDADSNIDEAVDGVMHSAFGFQGQKCSACSRAIVHKDIFEEFTQKLVAKTARLKLGFPENQDVYLGPVASKSAFESILKYIEIGAKEGQILTGGKSPKAGNGTVGSGGFFIEPTIIGPVSPTARIAQEEIFGPVLALIQADCWDDALKIANNTEFGLTGGVYTRNRQRLEEARRDFHVGNLYLNRKCTGALVGVQPFGGFNMSGTDSKAGGRDYLLLFTQAKVVAERY
jgi:1-pyrroline-5-carboxylate dehydrogenase